MLTLKGKYNTAIVYADAIDEASAAQVVQLCNQEFTKGSKIRMMPDVHAGAGCTIGTTMTITDKIVPNLVGVDIGCGMETVKIAEKDVVLEELDNLIYSKIPSGFAIRKEPHAYMKRVRLNELRCRDSVDLLRAEKSIGTLGGGNHFIEMDQDDKGHLYLVVHSGSRHLGLEVAKHYQNLAYHTLNGSTKEDQEQLIADYKALGREREIQKAVAALKNTKKTSIPKELAYAEGTLFEDYINDMKLVQQYAALNRKAMADEIIKGLKLTVAERFTTIHNYIDVEHWILRKGAVSANKGEKILIPMNMRDGSLICIGRGNPEWNYSAPHGAGRLMSRGKARDSLTLKEFSEQMEGIYTTSISRSTLDEAPMAYKNMKDIIDNIGDTAEIQQVIKPIYNFKAGQ